MARQHLSFFIYIFITYILVKVCRVLNKIEDIVAVLHIVVSDVFHFLNSTEDTLPNSVKQILKFQNASSKIFSRNIINTLDTGNGRSILALVFKTSTRTFVDSLTPKISVVGIVKNMLATMRLKYEQDVFVDAEEGKEEIEFHN